MVSATSWSEGMGVVARNGNEHDGHRRNSGVISDNSRATSGAPAGAGRTCATVMSIVSWDAERSEPEFRSGLRSKAWEVVVPELVFEPER